MTDDYQSTKAMSASMAWTLVNECPAQAWWESPWNPDRAEKNGKHLDIGTAAHLAVLESNIFAERTLIIDAEDYRTKGAREERDRAYIEGRAPLLWKDWELVLKLRKMLESSVAAELLFGGHGQNELAYYWDWDGVPCKAKADRIVYGSPSAVIVDLKTAVSASPEAFQRATVRDGHHLRAAWYIDGCCLAQGLTYKADIPRIGSEGELLGYERLRDPDYLFVVIAKEEPHLVSIFRFDEGAIEKGRTLYKRAIQLFRQCRDTGIWPAYTGLSPDLAIMTVSLPLWYEYRLADQEAEQEFANRMERDFDLQKAEGKP